MLCYQRKAMGIRGGFETQRKFVASLLRYVGERGERRMTVGTASSYNLQSHVRARPQVFPAGHSCLSRFSSSSTRHPRIMEPQSPPDTTQPGHLQQAVSTNCASPSSNDSAERSAEHVGEKRVPLGTFVISVGPAAVPSNEAHRDGEKWETADPDIRSCSVPSMPC